VVRSIRNPNRILPRRPCRDHKQAGGDFIQRPDQELEQ
jgi:hypothetical protein